MSHMSHREICIGVPDTKARAHILKVMTKKVRPVSLHLASNAFTSTHSQVVAPKKSLPNLTNPLCLSSMPLLCLPSTLFLYR